MNHGMRMSVRKRQRRAKLIRVITVTLITAALATTAIGSLVMAARLLPGKDAYYRGITVDGIALGGVSRTKADSQVYEQARHKLDSLKYTLVFGERSWPIQGTQLGVTVDTSSTLAAAWSAGHEGDWFKRYSEISNLSANPLELYSAVEYNKDLIEIFVNNIKLEIDRPVKQTKVFVASDMKLDYEPGEDGYELDAEKLSGYLAECLRTLTSADIDLSDMVSVTRPDKPPEIMEDSVKLLASRDTPIRSNHADRTSNIRRALEPFNGLALEPGDVVDFNKLVGPRTIKNGFKSAPQFGDEGLEDGIGGGVCQASTTLYHAALYAGMEIVKRSPHSKTVGYVEHSQDAAVTYGGKYEKNLIFRNNTNHTVYFATNVTSKKATVKVYGTVENPDVGIYVRSQDLEVIDQGEKIIEDDTQYEDYRKVESVGQPGIKSRAFRVYYNMRTEETIETENLGTDLYEPIDDRVIVGTMPLEE